jgi:signal transduction histidine kinase
MTVETSGDEIKISSRSGLHLAVPPAEASNLPDIVSALRALSELDGLSEEDYVWIATHCTERVGSDGAIVFAENEPSHHLNFFLRGEVLVHRRNSGPIALFIGRTGRITGKLPYSRMKAWAGDGRASGSFWSLDLHEDLFPAMLSAIPSMAQRCVWILLDRVRDFTRADEQTAKLIALGKLAANLAHELNNPASAARSAASAISSHLDGDDEAKYNLGFLCQSKEELDAYRTWLQKARDYINNSGDSRSVNATQSTASDREDELLRWLEARQVPNAWTIAPILAEAGLPIELFETLASAVSSSVLPLAMGNLAGVVRTQRAASTIRGSTTRIFDIISAIKNYSYMDQAPIQEINLAQSLDTTLAMLGSRLQQVTVQREYDPDLPTFKGFGSELNQVWTAIIENSLDAMKERGILRLSTRLKGRMIFVEVWDDGPGVEPALMSRIFEPFFTTKPIGTGLGLGLDVVQRVVNKHFGTVSVESKPFSTCFQVRLPLDRMQVY